MSTLTRDSTSEKVIRMSTSSNMIENGYVYLPEHAPWLAIYLHEMVTFDHGNQALGSGETVQNSPRWLGIIAVKEGGFRPSQSV